MKLSDKRHLPLCDRIDCDCETLGEEIICWEHELSRLLEEEKQAPRKEHSIVWNNRGVLICNAKFVLEYLRGLNNES